MSPTDFSTRVVGDSAKYRACRLNRELADQRGCDAPAQRCASPARASADPERTQREREVEYLKRKAAKLGFDILPHDPTTAVAQAVALV